LKKSIIAIQPLGYYSPSDERIKYLKNEMESFYHARVVVNNSIDIPKSFLVNDIDASCSADSLVPFLSKLCADTIADIIGLIHHPLFISKDTQRLIDNKIQKFPLKTSVLGLGYINGNSCIVSDFRLSSFDTTLMLKRIRNVTFHEFGHNLGLTHCLSDTCIMSEQNGDIGTLDIINGFYCSECMKKLH
jgi:archaemetzincin